MRDHLPWGGGYRRSPLVVGFVLVAVSIASSTAVAQSPCLEPDDEPYLSRMEAVARAVEAGDFEGALADLDWAVNHYPYAPIEYSRARALHRLDRLAEAEAGYNDFLRHYEGCDDVDDLRSAARNYRALAVNEQVARLAAASARPGGSDLSTPPPGANPVRATGWTLVGVGAAGLLGGVVFDLVHTGPRDDRDDALAAGDAVALAAANADIRDARAVDWVLYGGGVGLAVVGAILVLASGDTDPAGATDERSWRVTPTGFAVTF